MDEKSHFPFYLHYALDWESQHRNLQVLRPLKCLREPPLQYCKVSKGDTFWFIAKRYGLDYKQLMALNPNVNPYNMQVGSAIRLKGTVQPSSSFEEEVVRLVNAERSKQGLPPLLHRLDIKNVARKRRWI